MPSFRNARRPLLAIADLQETLAELDRDDRALAEEIEHWREKRRLLSIERQALAAGAAAIASSAGLSKGEDR